MTSALGVARYAGFAALAILGPGLAVQRLLRLRPDPALVVPLGTALAALGYWVAALSGHPQVLVAAVLLLDGMLVLDALRYRDRPWLSNFPWAVLLGPGLVLLALLALTQYGSNRLDATGAFRLD